MARERSWHKHNSVTILLILFLPAICVRAGTYSGGTGEPNTPYRIADANDLLEMAANSGDMGSYFVLVNDIDLAGAGSNVPAITVKVAESVSRVRLCSPGVSADAVKTTGRRSPPAIGISWTATLTPSTSSAIRYVSLKSPVLAATALIATVCPAPVEDGATERPLKTNLAGLVPATTA